VIWGYRAFVAAITPTRSGGTTVGRHGSEATIRDYIAGQGRQSEYLQLHTQQLDLFG